MLEHCGEMFWSSKMTPVCPGETRAFSREVHGCSVEMAGSSSDDLWCPKEMRVFPQVVLWCPLVCAKTGTGNDAWALQVCVCLPLVDVWVLQEGALVFQGGVWVMWGDSLVP